MSEKANKSHIGMIGLGVMGENLALNIERNGYTISVFNRHTDKVDAFVKGAAKGKNVVGCDSEQAFIASLAKPRMVILLVKAGDPVDSTIAKIEPYLEKGDIIIDAGNSHFQDTRRREKELEAKGFHFIGSGVSGGEEGALWGPSLMPGGDAKAYENLKPIWEKASAKVNGEPCVTYLGPDGAGHFVKMVHNGIEYGDMQIIAEAYDIMRRIGGLNAREMSDIFAKWNEGRLNSFLIEITSQILSAVDPETNKPLIDLILDKAGQKGTGKWTAEIADELGVPIPTIDAALAARVLSSMKSERIEAARSNLLNGPAISEVVSPAKEALVKQLESAILASRICSYAQGMALIAAGSKEYNWGVNMQETARIWRGGCIIRSTLLENIRKAFDKNIKLPNLLLDADVAAMVTAAQADWRSIIGLAVNAGIPVPALSASLSYFDSYRTESLPQNLIQAQRDFFGAHTYERVDKPQAGFMHTEWLNLIKVKAGQKS